MRGWLTKSLLVEDTIINEMMATTNTDIIVTNSQKRYFLLFISIFGRTLGIFTVTAGIVDWRILHRIHMVVIT